LCVINYAGKYETLIENLCSILAQLEYKYQIDQWHDNKDRLYVPKIHLVTKVKFCERDKQHVFNVKRCNWNVMFSKIAENWPKFKKMWSSRATIGKKRFEEALHEILSGLTYAALSGIITQINLTVPFTHL